ncbi:hypothetical protein NIES4071_10250 [Calothrix sp. NIES-4071]|nr:hypothetical protein NIES4071_10250 [Calothrix sp. NIES-4071]BAZ55366.1 hypothetical protein NIES4105_10210 [Calothrix sp. NIES-4105]
MSKNVNGNGHRIWNPVKIFIRLIQRIWKKQDLISGETYLVDLEVVKQDLDDIADDPDEQNNTNN